MHIKLLSDHSAQLEHLIRHLAWINLLSGMPLKNGLFFLSQIFPLIRFSDVLRLED